MNLLQPDFGPAYAARMSDADEQPFDNSGYSGQIAPEDDIAPLSLNENDFDLSMPSLDADSDTSNIPIPIPRPDMGDVAAASAYAQLNKFSDSSLAHSR